MSVFVLLVLCGTLYILWSWLKPRPLSPPILPGSLPIIGHAHQMFGNRRLITDPDDLGTVANTCLTKSYFYDFAKDFLNNGLITADGTSLGLDAKDQKMIDNDYAEAVDSMLNSYCERSQKLINEVVGNKEDIGKEELTKLVYLEAVIKETLRLYPVVPWIGRNIDINVKLKNYTVQAGSTCFMGIYGLHCHPMWGPDVMEFKPERWLNPATVPNNPKCFFTIWYWKAILYR
ncbi:hypothetical protein HF086_009949 [Spodoptera exigua]|uniref:Cytochrome p450 n=1 Tax=Spodoptera exigua TaxID=7107 RepID=A0A922M6G6_SPOEX|nr:hypothetical protein HF086_009949 [Spodoptera exigua]